MIKILLLYVVLTDTRKWVSQNTRSTRENRNDVFLSQSLPGPSSQASLSSQRSVKNSSYREIQPNRNALQDMQEQEKMQLVSGVIRYLFAADRSKHPIQKAHIVKNMLSGNVKDYRYVLENVKTQLHTVYPFWTLFKLIYKVSLCFMKQTAFLKEN